MTYKWLILPMGIILAMGGVIYFQYRVIDTRTSELATSREEVKSLTQERDQLEGKLAAFGSLTADLDKWKAVQDAKNTKFLTSLRATLENNKCAIEPVPVTTLRMQRQKAIDIRARAGVHTPSE